MTIENTIRDEVQTARRDYVCWLCDQPIETGAAMRVTTAMEGEHRIMTRSHPDPAVCLLAPGFEKNGWDHPAAETVVREGRGVYGFYDWEQDEDDPDQHWLTVKDPDGEEYATIVHRTCGGRFPLDGPDAQVKVVKARNIARAMNLAMRAGLLCPHTTAEAVRRRWLTPRPGEPGRYDVADAASPNTAYGCPVDDWCILNAGHPGECCDDRETVVDAGELLSF